MKNVARPSFLVGISTALLFSLLAQAAPSASSEYQKLRSDVEQFRNDSARTQYRHHYKKYMGKLERFTQRHKKSSRVDDAHYMRARLQEELSKVSRLKEDRSAAALLYEMCAKLFPKSNLADDALYRAALLHSQDGQLDSATDALKRAVDLGGDQQRRAERMLSRLGAAPEKQKGEGPGVPARSGILYRAKKTKKMARVKRVSLDKRGDSVIVSMSRDATVSVGVVGATGDKPDRVFYDVAPAVLDRKAFSGPVQIESALATRVRVAQFDKKTVRIVLDLKSKRLPHAAFDKSTHALTIPMVLQEDGLIASAAEQAPVLAASEPAEALGRANERDDKRPASVASASASKRMARPGDSAQVTDSKVSSDADDGAASVQPEVLSAVAPQETVKLKSRPAAEQKASVASKDAVRNEATGDVLTETKRTGVPAMDLDSASDAVAVATAKEAPASAAQGVQQLGLGVRRIVIDAGHGGKDTGAVGPTGLREKYVTLDIARRVRDKLRRKLPDVEVILTRDKDVFVALRDRTAIANDAQADLFISIHANANPSRKVSGVETYYLNITHDKYAKRLATRENRDAADHHKISDLEFILADLAMKSNVDDSIRLGRQVQSSVVTSLRDKYATVNDHGLKHALFYVLLGTRMPAILVETSFISNRTEEKRLSSKKYRSQVADGVVSGVARYVEERRAFARK